MYDRISMENVGEETCKQSLNEVINSLKNPSNHMAMHQKGMFYTLLYVDIII
jgi:hypothetical protein